MEDKMNIAEQNKTGSWENEKKNMSQIDYTNIDEKNS